MRKLALAILIFAAIQAHATCTVQNIVVYAGGQYQDASGFAITITGPGVGGAVASPNFVYIGAPGYLYLSSIDVTNGGSYTGPATVTLTGGDYTQPAQAYVVMGGTCGAGGSGHRKVYAWLI
jgi:hypothetical protein